MKDAALHPVRHILVHGHFWLVLGVVAQLWWVDGLFRFHIDHRLYGVVALATFSTYGGMRLLRMRVPEHGANAMMNWYRSNALVMRSLVIGSGIGALVLAWPMRHLVLHSLWLPTLLAAGYTLPLALTGGRPNGLRRIPLLKALIIGFVWASLLVVLPGTVEQNGMPFIPVEVWLLGFIWTCTIMAIAIAFDIRDLPHDPPSLRTVPQVLGPFGAKVVATLLLIPLFLLLLFLLVMGQGATGSGWRGSQLDLSLVLPALGVVGLAMLIIRSDPRRPWWYWDLLMDGALIVMPLLAWVGHQL